MNNKRRDMLQSLLLAASPFQVGDIIHLQRVGKKAVIKRLELPYTPCNATTEQIGREVRGDMSYMKANGDFSARTVSFHWYDRAVVVGKIAKEGGGA